MKTIRRFIQHCWLYVVMAVVGVPVAASAFVRLSPASQISGAILVAGFLIAAAIWCSETIVVHLHVEKKDDR